MDSAFRGQGGIQMLLTAEQEAQKIVSDARSLKISRLKQAKFEAERDVESHRSQMESEYQKKVSESSSGLYTKRLEEDTKSKIQNLRNSSATVTSDIVDMLIKYVMTIRN